MRIEARGNTLRGLLNGVPITLPTHDDALKGGQTGIVMNPGNETALYAWGRMARWYACVAVATDEAVFLHCRLPQVFMMRDPRDTVFSTIMLRVRARYLAGRAAFRGPA